MMRKRVQVLFKVEQTLDNYCRACPYLGGNSPHKNCMNCPVSHRLQEYGHELGWQDDSSKPHKHERWTIEEQDILVSSFGNMPVRAIAEKLNRSQDSVTKRITRMRKKGELA